MVESIASNGVSPVIEVSEESPGALVPNQVVRFLAKREAPSVFNFDVSEKSKITIEVWDQDTEAPSRISMLAIANDEQNDITKYTWKNGVNLNKIEIHPDRRDFELGTYRVVL